MFWKFWPLTTIQWMWSQIFRPFHSFSNLPVCIRNVNVNFSIWSFLRSFPAIRLSSACIQLDLSLKYGFLRLFDKQKHRKHWVSVVVHITIIAFIGKNQFVLTHYSVMAVNLLRLAFFTIPLRLSSMFLFAFVPKDSVQRKVCCSPYHVFFIL